jgi:hypothetical protein
VKKKTHKQGRPPTITEELIPLVAKMLACDFRTWEIKQALREKTQKPDLSARSCQTAIRKAQTLLAVEWGKTPEEHKRTSLHFYAELARDESTPAAVRIKARERIDRIMGLEAPSIVRHGGEAGNPVVTETTTKHQFDHSQFAKLFGDFASRNGERPPGSNGHGKPVHSEDAAPAASRISDASLS